MNHNESILSVKKICKRKRDDVLVNIRVDIEARKQLWQQAGLLTTKVSNANVVATEAGAAGLNSRPEKKCSPEQQERQNEIMARQQLWQQAGIASDPKMIKRLPNFSEQSPYSRDKTLVGKLKYFVWCYQHRP